MNPTVPGGLAPAPAGHPNAGATNAETTGAGAARHAAGTAFLGMVIFMASWAMLFAGLFFAYGIVRQGAPAWPPPDLPRAPIGLPFLATGALGAASLCLHRALTRTRRGQGQGLAALLSTAGLAGAAFLALQILVWRALWLAGLSPNTGTYASVFYTLTVFHGVHVLVGIAGILWVAVRAKIGAYDRMHHVPIHLWSLYWHMVGIVWAVMFILLYLF